ncbi:MULTISPECIES: very short patch repair endonuclease [unclassified Streptomyces]|uniref:very short patch repair endonuclease n=1 Tax=unclassified Streptomyces TaxID=2593676 RepID=UPI001907DCEB|nr:very short patch repair endonuclease [Streptomyces sp. HSG2]
MDDTRRLETSPATRARMSRQKSRDTRTEIALRHLLHAAGLRYRVHRRPVREVRREADIVFGPAKVAVFVDGCFWHGCPDHATWPKNNAAFWKEKIQKNRARDLDTDARLEAAGWLPLRVWEHERAEAAADRVIEVVRRRREAPCRGTGSSGLGGRDPGSPTSRGDHPATAHVSSERS